MPPIKHSILGERKSRIPTGGKIRAGIQILTAKAAANKQAAYLYEKGVERGASYEQIAKAIAEHKNCQGLGKRVLRPKNTPHFVVLARDFAMPETANLILDRYGEERDGDDYPEGRYLYRFPVVFASDVILHNMPHGLECWGRSGKKYWSAYDEDGERYCKMYAPPAKSEHAKRVVRPFGGRASIKRTDLDPNGLCVPEQCPEYQSGHCVLTGKLLFFIPGVPSAAAIELRTNSFYGMSSWMDTMALVADNRGGRVAGTVNGNPIFWVTKTHEEVPRVDPETGESTIVKQWIPRLEVPIDMAALSAYEEKRRLEGPANAITGPTKTVEATTQEPEAVSLPAVEDVDELADRLHNDEGEVVDDFDDDIPF